MSTRLVRFCAATPSHQRRHSDFRHHHHCPPHTIVEITGVTFSGSSASVVISIVGTSSVRPVWVTFCNCVFVNGAALHFTADASDSDARKGQTACLHQHGRDKVYRRWIGFHRGHFPSNSRIVIAPLFFIHQQSCITAASVGSNVPLGTRTDDLRTGWRCSKCICTPRPRSWLRVLFFGGTWASGQGSAAHASFPISLAYAFPLNDQSTFWMRNTTTAKVFMIHGDRSAFVMAYNSASVPLGEEGEDLFYTGATTVFSGNRRAFLIHHNVLSPYRYAFSSDSFYGKGQQHCFPFT